jgi:hypothetical protein
MSQARCRRSSEIRLYGDRQWYGADDIVPSSCCICYPDQAQGRQSALLRRMVSHRVRTGDRRRQYHCQWYYQDHRRDSRCGQSPDHGRGSLGFQLLEPIVLPQDESVCMRWAVRVDMGRAVMPIPMVESISQIRRRSPPMYQLSQGHGMVPIISAQTSELYHISEPIVAMDSRHSLVMVELLL